MDALCAPSQRCAPPGAQLQPSTAEPTRWAPQPGGDAALNPQSDVRGADRSGRCGEVRGGLAQRDAVEGRPSVGRAAVVKAGSQPF